MGVLACDRNKGVGNVTVGGAVGCMWWIGRAFGSDGAWELWEEWDVWEL